MCDNRENILRLGIDLKTKASEGQMNILYKIIDNPLSRNFLSLICESIMKYLHQFIYIKCVLHRNICYSFLLFLWYGK